jgi:outer membrane beta-barrel protein
LAVVFVLFFFAAPAFGQEKELGLDLTDEEKKQDQKAKEPQEVEQKPAPAGTRTPAAGPGASATAGVKPSTSSASLQGERDIIQEDRVKSVQRKVYLKKSRFELAPSVSATVNDPYYLKTGLGLRAGYYFADTLALAGRFVWMNVYPNDDVRTAKRDFQSRIFFSVPVWSAMADLEWSPLYGKVSIFNSILHLDSYLLGGVGVVVTDTSALPGRGPNPAADLGIGMRLVVKDFLAVNVALINTTYVDQPTGTTKGATQNLMMLSTGLSVFVPFRSTGREGE